MDYKNLQNDVEKYFETQKDILCVYLFGSFSRGTNSSKSDLDIGVILKEHNNSNAYYQRRLELMGDLSSIVKREVDVVILNNTSTFMKFHVLESGKRIYENRYRESRSFEAKAMVEYFDFAFIKNRLEKGLIKNLRKANHG